MYFCLRHHTMMWASVCGCPALKATTSSFGKTRWTERQEAGDWGQWGATARWEELWQTRGVCDPSFLRRQSLLLWPLLSTAPDPNHFSLPDLRYKTIFIGICEGNSGAREMEVGGEGKQCLSFIGLASDFAPYPVQASGRVKRQAL